MAPSLICTTFSWHQPTGSEHTKQATIKFAIAVLFIFPRSLYPVNLSLPEVSWSLGSWSNNVQVINFITFGAELYGFMYYELWSWRFVMWKPRRFLVQSSVQWEVTQTLLLGSYSTIIRFTLTKVTLHQWKVSITAMFMTSLWLMFCTGCKPACLPAAPTKRAGSSLAKWKI